MGVNSLLNNIRTKGLRAEGGIDELEPVVDHTQEVMEAVDGLLEGLKNDLDQLGFDYDSIKFLGNERRLASKKVGHKIKVFRGEPENARGTAATQGRIDYLKGMSDFHQKYPEAYPEEVGKRAHEWADTAEKEGPHITMNAKHSLDQAKRTGSMYGAGKQFKDTFTHELGHHTDEVTSKYAEPADATKEYGMGLRNGQLKGEARAWRAAREIRKEIGIFNGFGPIDREHIRGHMDYLQDTLPKSNFYQDHENPYLKKESVDQIVDRLLEEADPDTDENEFGYFDQYGKINNPGDRFHVTSKRSLRGIAQDGLLPNTGGQFGFNFEADTAQANSEDRVFYSSRLKDANKWVADVGSAIHNFDKTKPTMAVLKAKDPDPDQFEVDPLGGRSEQFSMKEMPTEKLDVWHAKTGWTPLGAHDPSRWDKVRPGHLRLDAKPKGQMQLFPKELYNEAVMNIVNELLSETTFLQAYKYGGLSKDQIRNMSNMRNAANARFGQKIPVLSTDTGTEGVTPFGKFDKTSSAFGEYDVEQRNNSNSDYEYERSDNSPTEKLHAKLSGTTPHVRIDVGIIGKGEGYNKKPRSSDTAVEALGHELGHIIDPVQNDKDHVAKDRKGRRMFMFPGASNVDASPSRKKVMKSEGRAWRVGRDLQQSVDAFDQDRWTHIARTSLRSYTGPHVESINEIVDNLLDETTFLQARRAGDLDKPKIKAMSAMRKSASEQYGQKIPVISTSRGDGYDGPSLAVPERLVGSGTGSRAADDLIDMLRTMLPASPTEKLAHKLSGEKAHVQINVSGDTDNAWKGDSEAKHAVAITGHELGHVVDPVQNAVSHAYMDKDGRKQLRDEDWYYEGKHKVTPEIKKVLKSEGRAWRVGKGLQTQAGALSTPEDKDNWEKIARVSLKGYAGNYLK